MNKRCSQEWPDRSCTAWLARRIRNRLLPLLAALMVLSLLACGAKDGNKAAAKWI